MSPKPSTSDLRAAIARQIEQAASATDIADERAELFNRYMAEPYGDEVEGRSQVVSTDISDTVEWIMPELMEIFTSGDKVVSFEPVGPDDELLAEQETDTVNHVFMRQNEGFLILYSMFKDALIQKVGYAKRWWDTSETTEVEQYDGLTPDELQLLVAQWDQAGAEWQIVESDVSSDEGIHIKARVTQREEQMRVVPVPPEEILVAARWNSIFLDRCPFVAHRPSGVTVSELVEEGYDGEQLKRLCDADESNEERTARFSQKGSEEAADQEATDASMREVRIHECYIRIDRDGDGIAELCKVMVGGSGHEILKKDGEDAIEEVQSVPFSALTPVLTPHRHFGRSVAELITDLQRIKTVLQRQMLDNVYFSNTPTREISEEGIVENTIEDMLTERPGKIVRTKMAGQYFEHTPPMLLGNILPSIEYFDTVRESRAGVSRLSQGLDANTINKTAKGQAQLLSASQKKIALIARIFAETGVKGLMRGIHDDLRRNASRALTMRLRGTWVTVDPRHWRSRADVSANVALGVGNAEQQIQKLMLIADKQEQNLLNGSPLVTPKNLLHTYEKIVDVAGFKNPGAFFNDPEQNPPQQQEPPPNPAMIQVQGMLEIERMKAQNAADAKMAEIALERDRAAREDDRKRDEANLRFALDYAKILADRGIAVDVATIQASGRMLSSMNQPPASQPAAGPMGPSQ